MLVFHSDESKPASTVSLKISSNGLLNVGLHNLECKHC